MFTRYFIELSFKGTNYHGWQIQKNAISVQSIINNALSTILREDIKTIGAGRTDAGVHAKYFVAHFDSQNNTLHKNFKLINQLNNYLPKDITIKNIITVNNKTHARYDAIKRTYKYYINNVKDPFVSECSHCILKPLDIKLMNK